jgi:hypothetical protein
MLSIFIEGSSGWEPVPSIRLFAWPCVKLFDDMAIKGATASASQPPPGASHPPALGGLLGNLSGM